MVSAGNTSWPEQIGRHFADDIFKCIFFNKIDCILIQISLKFVREGPIDKKFTLDQLVISPECHIYASRNWVIIGSDNGLSPVRRQTITEPMPIGTKFSEI